jgi:hypothetical protein
MCSTVLFRGKVLDTQKTLMRATGLAVLPMLPAGFGLESNPAEGDVCLCQVDVEEVARQVGVYCEYNGLDYTFEEIDRS